MITVSIETKGFGFSNIHQKKGSYKKIASHFKKVVEREKEYMLNITIQLNEGSKQEFKKLIEKIK